MSRPIARRAPCNECPWRRDVAPGSYPVLPEALAQQQPDGSGHVPFDRPLPACHKTPEHHPLGCAGWLAVEGHNHLGVRLAVLRGTLARDATTPGDDWPPLVADMAEMVKRHPALETT